MSKSFKALRMRLKKYLSNPALIDKIYRFFETIPDVRHAKAKISLPDALISAFAMFQLKFPSLLAFVKTYNAQTVDTPRYQNLVRLYGMQKVPCDTQMRTILDEVDFQDLQLVYQSVISVVRREKLLSRQFQWANKKLLIAIDGTQYFTSNTIHCDHCCIKEHRDGTVTYYHQAVVAVIVHPRENIVLPIWVEPVLRQDGETKNDCELNAAKRLIMHLKEHYPQEQLSITQDSLFANGPYIELLKTMKMDFIFTAKLGNLTALLTEFETEKENNTVQKHVVKNTDGSIQEYTWKENLSLNASHEDCKVNVLECKVTNHKGKLSAWCWITNQSLNHKTVTQIAQAARSRWRIENETFNTLKNYDYHLEHNYGHGYKNLSVNLCLLMFLAFLIDQVVEFSCDCFKQALVSAYSTKRALWFKMRSQFEMLLFTDWLHFYKVLIFGVQPIYAVYHDSS